MKKSAAFFTGILVTLLAGFFIVSSPVLAACAPGAPDTLSGLCQTASNAGLDKQKSITQVTGNVIGTALSMVGVLFFGLMIYGGINWMVDRGNEDRAKKALDTIIAAVIGLVIILSSYAITKFVFGSVDGGGSPAPGAPQAQSQCNMPGFSCKALSACAPAQASRDACRADAGNCKLDLCPGANDVVCCK